MVDYTHNIWVIELTNFKILWDLYLCSASYLCVSLSSLQDGYLTFYLDDGTNSHQQVLLRPEDNRDLNDWRWHKISVERMGRHVRNTSLAIFIVRRGWGVGRGSIFRILLWIQASIQENTYSCLYVNFCNLHISGGRVGGAIIGNLSWIYMYTVNARPRKYLYTLFVPWRCLIIGLFK